MLGRAKRFVISNAWFAFPLAVACLALFWFAVKASVWLDEAFTLQEAQFSYGVLWQALHHVDGTFLAYYGLLHLWIRIAGTSALALRIPSIAGVLAGLGLLYASIARRADAFSASLATAFVAAAALVVAIGGEARPYGLAFGFCAASIYVLLRCFETMTPARSAAYVVCIAIALYLHPLTVLLFVAQWITIAFASRERTEMRILLLALPLGCCSLVPVFVLVHAGGTGQLDWIRPLTWITARDFARGLFGAYWGLPLLAIAASFAAALSMNRDKADVAICATTWFTVPIALLFGISAFKPMLIPYYVLYVWLPAGMMVGLGLHAVRPRPLFRGLAAVLVLGLVIWNLSLVPEGLQRGENWRGLVSYYLAHRAQGDAFVVYAPFTVLPFRYAFAERGEPAPEVVFPADPVVRDAITRRALSEDEVRRLRSKRTVWLVLSHAAIARPATRRDLRALFQHCRLGSSHTVPSHLRNPLQIDRFDCALRG